MKKKNKEKKLKEEIKDLKENWYWKNRLVVVIICRLVVFIICICILVLGIIWMSLDILIKEKFTIYKEECWNENYTNSLMAISERGLSKIMLERNVIKCLKKEIITPTEGFFRGVTFYFCDYNISYEEVCEKKEVEEIEYKCITGIENKNGIKTFYRSFCQINPPRDIFDFIFFNLRRRYTQKSFCDKSKFEGCAIPKKDDKILEHRIIVFPKKDITKEWLDENCELIKSGCGDGFCDVNNGERFSNCEKDCCLLGQQGKLPVKYKCFENYFVEVK